ncbi:hypothetical protein ACFLSX_02335 [Calditrichota bacterium]
MLREARYWVQQLPLNVWAKEDMFHYYRTIWKLLMVIEGGRSMVSEPPYTRPAWFILSEAEGYDGVRGALRLI